MKDKRLNKNKLKAIYFIFLCWAMCFGLSLFMSILSGGEYFWIRFFIIYPFIILNFRLTKLIWNNYRENQTK